MEALPSAADQPCLRPYGGKAAQAKTATKYQRLPTRLPGSKLWAGLELICKQQWEYNGFFDKC